jgi:uncharacterized protein (TIGR03435 family)
MAWRRIRDETGRRRKLLLSAVGLAGVAATIMFGLTTVTPIKAQTAPAARPQFEVASVKPNTTNGRMDPFPVRSGNLVRMHNNQVGSMILYAYHVAQYQVIGDLRLPDPWNWYDIEATVEGTPSDDDIRLMFQSLLEDRFKLKVHRETREMEVYKLVVAKNGSKLKPATEEDYKTTIEGKPVIVRKGTSGILHFGEGAHLMGKSVTIAQLASSLEGVLKGPVIDGTGLPGTFDYDVLFLPDGQVPATEFSAPTLLAALKTELGLTIEKVKAPVEVLVIDHLEKPSPN